MNRERVKAAVVIGLGSMGRRRVRLLKAFPDAPKTVVGVNRSAERRAAAAQELGIDVYATLEEAVAAAKPQVALVCTAPASHGPAVLQCLDLGLDVFMELNLIGDWYDEALAKAKEKGRRLFVAATPVYRREMAYIASVVKGETVNYLCRRETAYFLDFALHGKANINSIPYANAIIRFLTAS